MCKEKKMNILKRNKTKKKRKKKSEIINGKKLKNKK